MTPFDPQPVPRPIVEPPPTPPFHPMFRQDVIGTSAYGGSWQLNPYYFATPETADYMMRRFHAIGWAERPSTAANGPFTVNAPEIVLIFQGGVAINCGMLARYFDLWPEDQVPGLAERTVNEAIANVEQKATG